MSQKNCIFLAIFILIFWTSSVRADAPDRKIALWIANQVVNYIHEIGISGLQQEMFGENQAFRYRDIYAFVLDEEANMIAHGANKALVGRNMYNIRNSDGVFVFQHMQNQLGSYPDKWVSYRWANPINNKIQEKDVYIKKVKGFYVAVGIYQPPLSTEHLAKYSNLNAEVLTRLKLKSRPDRPDHQEQAK